MKILLGLLALLTGIIGIKNTIPAFTTTPTPTVLPSAIANKNTPTPPTSGMIQLPEIVKTQESLAELLPTLPSPFPVPDEDLLTNSYIGHVTNDEKKIAYGAIWKFENETVPEIMEEEFLDKNEHLQQGLANTWLFDEPPDVTNTTIQKLRAHNKSGDYVFLTALQENTDVIVTATFIHINQ